MATKNERFIRDVTATINSGNALNAAQKKTLQVLDPKLLAVANQKQNDRFLTTFNGLDTPNAGQIKTFETLTGQKYDPAQKKLDAMKALLGKNRDAYIADQTGLLSKTRDDAIAQLQVAYQNAVDDGNMSIEEAKKGFEATKQQIDQQAYQNSQSSDILAYNNGIQNSMQMLGLKAGDNARVQDAVSTATSDRDSRVNEIMNRLSSLAKEKDINVANANNAYNSGIASATAQANQMYNSGLLDLGQSAYNTATQQQQANQQHVWDLDTIALNQKNDLEKMSVQNGYDTALARMSAGLSAKSNAVNSANASKVITPLANAYSNFKNTKQGTALDQYYKSQEKIFKPSVVMKNPVMPIPSVANNQALSSWEKYRMITKGL